MDHYRLYIILAKQINPYYFQRRLKIIFLIIFFTYSQSINVFLLWVMAKYWTKSHEWSKLFQLKHIQLLINTYFKRYFCLILFSTKLTRTGMAIFNPFEVLSISTSTQGLGVLVPNRLHLVSLQYWDLHFLHTMPAFYHQAPISVPNMFCWVFKTLSNVLKKIFKI